MSKKKKANKNLIWGLVTIAGLILLILPTFLSIFALSGGSELINYSGQTGFGLFADLSSVDSSWLATVVSITLIAGLALAAVYVILYALEALKVVKQDFSKIRKLIALILFVLCLATLICGLIFVGNAGALDLGFLANAQLVTSAGFWLGISGMAITSVAGFMAAK